jgi:hypothetical protein
MKILKRPIDRRHLRSVPPRGFGWLDHRLLRDGYFERLSVAALALYALLVCASDAQGLSYYSDRRLMALLGLDQATLWRARRELIAVNLLAHQAPLTQVLSLAEVPPAFVRGGDTGTSTSNQAVPPAPATPAPPVWPAGSMPSLRAMVEAALRGEGGMA